MVTRTVKLVAVVFALTLLAASSLSAQTTLRWKFAPGQVFNQMSAQESVTSMNVGGQAIDTTMTLIVDSVWTINAVDPQGKAEITQTTPRVRLKIVSPVLGTTDADTSAETKPLNPVASQLKLLTTSQFNFSMSNVGEISNVQIVTTNAKPAAGGGQLAEMFGKDGLVSLVKQSMFPLPMEPLEKGSKWDRKIDIEVPMLGKVTATTAMTYQGPAQVDGKTLEQVQTDSVTEVGAKQGASPVAQLSIKEQSDKGSFYFDNVAGRFSHSESVQTMKMQVTAAGQMIDQTVKTVRKASLAPAAK